MRNSASPHGFDLWEAVDSLRETFAPRAAERPAPDDIRGAVLLALADEPMHGYGVIRAIEARSQGAWKPSPGSVYPTLQLLADEGLATSEQVGERKVYSLTPSGRDAAAQAVDEPKPSGTERAALPRAGVKLAGAIAQVAQAGTPEQARSAAAVLDEARRRLYAILAED